MVRDHIRQGLSIVVLLISIPILVGVTLVLAGGGCDQATGNVSERLYLMRCEPTDFAFGEVTVGQQSELTFGVEAYSSLSRKDFLGRPVHGATSTVFDLNGFTVTECSTGDPASFEVPGPFPVQMESDAIAWEFDTHEFALQFAPNVEASYSCILEPDFELIDYPATADIIEIRECRLTATGTALPPLPPSCALDPPSAIVDFGEVEVGGERWASLVISNENPDNSAENKFFYSFDDPGGDCAFFNIDPPTDASGLIGPAGSASGSKQVLTRFSPEAAGPFACVRTLTAFTEAGGDEIVGLCPASVSWVGTGVAAPPTAPSWSACTAPNTGNLHAVTGLSASEVYVAGDGGSVLTSSGDCQWQSAGTGFTEVDLRDLWVHEDGGQFALWAVGNIPPAQGFYQETGAILYTDVPEQSSWTQIDEDGLQTFEAIWGSAPSDIYFAGLGVSTDFPNAKWYSGDPPTLEEFIISWSGMSEVTAMSGTGADDVWAVIHESWSAVYRFSGGNPLEPWEDLTPSYAPISPLNDVFVRKGSGWEAVYAVGDGGGIYHWDGQQWLDDESIEGQDGDFHGVWVSPTGTVFAVGEGPMIYRGHVNEPGQWSRQTIPAEAVSVVDILYDVWGTDDDNVYAVGTNGVILRYAPPNVAAVSSR